MMLHALQRRVSLATWGYAFGIEPSLRSGAAAIMHLPIGCLSCRMPPSMMLCRFDRLDFVANTFSSVPPRRFFVRFVPA